MKRKGKLSLMATLLMIGLIPMICSAAIIAIVSAVDLQTELVDGVHEKLQTACIELEMLYADEWEAVENAEYGAIDTKEVDSLQNLGIELTVFKGDTRMQTSVRNDKGERDIGTKAGDKVIQTVLSEGKEYKSDDVTIAGTKYYAYYEPIKVDGQVVGMAFAGQKQAKVTDVINEVIKKVIIISVACVVAFAALVAFISFLVKKPLGQVANSLKRVADGDLTEKIEIKSTLNETCELINSTELVKNNLYNTVEGILRESDSLKNNADNLSDTLEQTNTAVSQIGGAINDVAQGATSQAEDTADTMASIEELAASLDSISAEVENLTHNTAEAADASDVAKATMQELVDINNQTKEKIDDIVSQSITNVDSANKINEIVGQIKAISDQTNLLSLNASIEAARAGEAGKGFAVVAGEIGSLSQQTKEASAEIEDIVGNLIREIKTTADKAGDLNDNAVIQVEKLTTTNEKFGVVTDAIETIRTVTVTVDTSVKTIDKVKKAITDKVENLSAISEENSASAQETTASASMVTSDMESLKEVGDSVNTAANTMADLMSIFKIN